MTYQRFWPEFFNMTLHMGLKLPAKYKFIRIQIFLQTESSTTPILTQVGELLNPNELFVHICYTFYYRATFKAQNKNLQQQIIFEFLDASLDLSTTPLFENNYFITLKV